MQVTIDLPDAHYRNVGKVVGAINLLRAIRQLPALTIEQFIMRATVRTMRANAQKHGVE